MMRLILVRHGKSDWTDAARDDHDRPLAPRGQRAATAIGHWLAARGHVPDLALCSTALRTRETWERIAMALPETPRTIHHADLYLATAEVILARVPSAPAATALLVGHNPGIGEATARLATAPPPHPRFADYPTGATTVLDFPGVPEWGAGQVVDFTVPRDLD